MKRAIFVYFLKFHFHHNVFLAFLAEQFLFCVAVNLA